MFRLVCGLADQPKKLPAFWGGLVNACGAECHCLTWDASQGLGKHHEEAGPLRRSNHARSSIGKSRRKCFGCLKR